MWAEIELMSDSARDMLKAESAYLAGVEGKLSAAKGKQLQGTIWRTVRTDGSDRLRAVMANHRVYDRERVKELPQNRRIALHGFERKWWFGKRPTGVAIATVLNPFDALVSRPDEQPPPIDMGDLAAHVRELVTDTQVPYVIGVCAPSGFTADARSIKLDVPNVTLVLIEPDDDGGWRVAGCDEDLPEYVRALFDPEDAGEKVDRVREKIETRSADLLTGGISASAMAEQLNVPKKLAVAAIEKMAQGDPELHMTVKNGDALLYRGAAQTTTESPFMNVIDRIRQLFSSEGDEAEKINVLAERRAGLAQRRDRLYEDIGKLEAKEADLLQQGRTNKSSVARRRIAAQLAQVRKDVARQNTTANMLNQQINIVSTDIHNLTLIQQGNMANLPNTEELTENAVKAEEMLETLSVDAEMVASLETGLADVGTSDEELAILREFDEVTEEPAAEPAAPEKKISESRAADPVEPAPREPEAPERKADPEAG
jgi:hypothetical protein